MSVVTGRSNGDVQQAYHALHLLWDKAGCVGSFEEWFDSQLIDLPEVTNTELVETPVFDEDGAYLYSTWK